MTQRTQYWFPAKQYGWGWGPPVVWQGWAAMASIAGLMIIGVLFFLPAFGAIAFLLYAGALSLLQFGICLLKGEPPRWRWGGR